ncbi:hypothetical protein IMG5_164980 [Ichthyophthirius multifiliis]|uniref:Transmembrane protein n=1 Tax=Ichthyophthirius multifiliis TaxID=5932 RepID=G0R0H8_ICHMU|nr:hypothetical protein IMG5_164980 [Ichthyophthirius multifiliis]EGR29029.1 hypothetical protein IMG5_164980 [Ichthyophthirius multifiliis]|eukprot:XP_004030265.1 hypothetical protein IMG5_164980 [Ichthyophthirius multifiliis]
MSVQNPQETTSLKTDIETQRLQEKQENAEVAETLLGILFAFFVIVDVMLLVGLWLLKKEHSILQMHVVFSALYIIIALVLIISITVYDDVACGTLHTFAMIYYIGFYATILVKLVLWCILLVFKYSDSKDKKN